MRVIRQSRYGNEGAFSAVGQMTIRQSKGQYEIKITHHRGCRLDDDHGR
jgi:hypothetical protein